MAKRGTLEHPKTRKLARELDISLCHALGVIEALRHVTIRLAPNGLIGKFDNQDIADEIGWDGDADELVRGLVATRWLDETPKGVALHDWWEHSDDYLHMALARAGERFWDGRIPRMGRMTKTDRDRCTALFEESAPQALSERSASAKQALSERSDSANLNCALNKRSASALPNTPLPSPSPLRSKRNQETNSARAAAGQNGQGDSSLALSGSGPGPEGLDYSTMPHDELKLRSDSGDDHARHELIERRLAQLSGEYTR